MIELRHQIFRAGFLHDVDITCSLFWPLNQIIENIYRFTLWLLFRKNFRIFFFINAHFPETWILRERLLTCFVCTQCSRDPARKNNLHLQAQPMCKPFSHFLRWSKNTCILILDENFTGVGYKVSHKTITLPYNHPLASDFEIFLTL